jgi:hypothetical protein
MMQKTITPDLKAIAEGKGANIPANVSLKWVEDTKDLSINNFVISRSRRIDKSGDITAGFVNPAGAKVEVILGQLLRGNPR